MKNWKINLNKLTLNFVILIDIILFTVVIVFFIHAFFTNLFFFLEKFINPDVVLNMTDKINNCSHSTYVKIIHDDGS